MVEHLLCMQEVAGLIPELPGKSGGNPDLELWRATVNRYELVSRSRSTTTMQIDDKRIRIACLG